MRLPISHFLRAFKNAQKGASLAEYVIVASFVAIATVVAVLALGQTSETVFCLSDSAVAEKTLGVDEKLCERAIVIPPPPPPPPPVPVPVPVVVSSEMVGFLNPTGPIPLISGQTDLAAPVEGNVDETLIMDALCVFLGFEAPAVAYTFTTGTTGNALFLPGGQAIWGDPDLNGEAWDHDTDALPLTFVNGSTPIVETLTCTETVLQ